MNLGCGDNLYELLGTPTEITLFNGEIVRPGDRVFHEKYKYGTVISFGQSGSSIYNLDVKFDKWDDIMVGHQLNLNTKPYDVSLWGSQEPLISKVCANVY